jgi:hypothetical protein
MPLNRIDHIALEVPALEPLIDKFASTGGLRLLRRGTATATGVRIAMLGDRKDRADRKSSRDIPSLSPHRLPVRRRGRFD